MSNKTEICQKLSNLLNNDPIRKVLLLTVSPLFLFIIFLIFAMAQILPFCFKHNFGICNRCLIVSLIYFKESLLQSQVLKNSNIWKIQISLAFIISKNSQLLVFSSFLPFLLVISIYNLPLSFRKTFYVNSTTIKLLVI